MKHLKFNTFLLTLLLSMVGITASAHDIEVENEGKTIYYVWTNNYTELAVSYRGDYSYSYSNEYSGNVVIPESVTYNGATYPVTSIGSSAFYYCSSLTSVTIGNSVTSIGSSAFYYCSSLTSVTIPNSVTSIGDRAFSFCSGLTSVTIPNSVTSIGSYAFRDCSGLTSVTIPNSVTSIEYGVFYGCSGLTSVTIPNSVTSIGGSAFCDCSGLTSVTIPNSVTSIGQSAFEGCSGLTSVKVASDNSTYDSRDNCNAIIETASKTLIAGCKNTIIPSSVTSIGNYAFQGCSSLTSVTIPNSVKSIGNYAFQGCSSLTSVTIPSSVTSIGDYAFYNCSGLTSVTIPSSATSIGGYAFAYCSGLTEVYCYAKNVPTTSTSAFYKSPISSATLHVPAASLSSYQTTEPWSGFGNIVGDIVLKCATPTIALANGKLTFTSETEGASFVSSLSFADASLHNSSEVSLAAKYRISVYAKKEGYADSDVATMDIDLATTGDVNGDGEVTIADAVAVVDIILNSPSAAPETRYYYSVGTEEVTAENYTTANDAQYKPTLSEIPETLDLSSINSQKAYILLPEGCALIIRNAQGVVGTTSVALGNGHTVHTTTSAINGSECTCMVVK